MNLKNIIVTTIASTFGRKYAARIGRRFGLSERQVMTIIATATPFVIGAIRKSRKSRNARNKNTEL